jgi:OmpA-OmpF porin, OOP family
LKTNRLLFYVFAGIMACCFAVSSLAADIQGSKDHPQFKRYEGAEIVKYEFREYDELTVPLGKAKHSQALVDSRRVEGAITRLTYKIPLGRSPLEVVRNYEAELKTDGFLELFRGAKDELGSSFAEAAGYKKIIWSPNIAALTMNGDSQIFLAMQKQSGDADYIIMIYSVENRFWASNLNKKDGLAKGQTLVQVDIVERKAMEAKMVVVVAEEMAEEISSSGRVALYGILFDTDKASIKAESTESIIEIAKLLKNDPSLNLLVVGHTDSVGDFGYNMNLSQDRAAAVVAELTEKHGIEARRLKSVGVSYACPVAPNSSEEGRAKNRRVELVADNQ